MELREDHYFIFKIIQLITSALVVLLTIIFVALPFTEFSLSDGIEILLIFAGLNLLSNGIQNKPIKK